MIAEVQINNSTSPKARYVSWVPSPCRVRLSNPTGAIGPLVNVTLKSVSAAKAGAIQFRKTANGAATATLALQLPINGGSVPFFVSGKFGRPSLNDGDVRIEVRAGTTLIGRTTLMVRVRKNANKLTAGERDRFVAAFAQLNSQGAGRFVDFRNMHTSVSSPQAHGFPDSCRGTAPTCSISSASSRPSMRAWRCLTGASISPRPISSRSISSASLNNLGAVQFSATNPLQFWVTDGVQGINRRPFFNTTTGSANVITEAATLALGNQYPAFRTLEGNPHGFAHTSFGGSISSIGTAAQGSALLPAPRQRRSVVGQVAAAVRPLRSGAGGVAYDSVPASPIGHNLADTMWPWNGITGGTRPPTAPGGALAASPSATAPGPQPRVRDGLDFQGRVNPKARLGF